MKRTLKKTQNGLTSLKLTTQSTKQEIRKKEKKRRRKKREISNGLDKVNEMR